MLRGEGAVQGGSTGSADLIEPAIQRARQVRRSDGVVKAYSKFRKGIPSVVIFTVERVLQELSIRQYHETVL